MYTKPKLERFGDLRTLTLVGIDGSTDGFTVKGISSTSSTGCGWFTKHYPCLESPTTS